MCLPVTHQHGILPQNPRVFKQTKLYKMFEKRAAILRIVMWKDLHETIEIRICQYHSYESSLYGLFCLPSSCQ